MRRSNRRFLISIITVIATSLLLLFFVINSKQSTSRKSVLTVPCDCDQVKYVENKSKNLNPIPSEQNRLTMCQDLDKNSSILRAILIYYPDHQANDFFPEVRW